MVVHTEGQRSNYYITLLYCCRFQVITYSGSKPQPISSAAPGKRKPSQPKSSAKKGSAMEGVSWASRKRLPGAGQYQNPKPLACRPASRGDRGGLERKGKGAVRSSLRSWPARSLRILYACFFKRNFTRILLTYFARFLLRAATVFFSRRSLGGEASDVGTPPATRRR